MTRLALAAAAVAVFVVCTLVTVGGAAWLAGMVEGGRGWRLRLAAGTSPAALTATFTAVVVVYVVVPGLATAWVVAELGGRWSS